MHILNISPGNTFVQYVLFTLHRWQPAVWHNKSRSHNSMALKRNGWTKIQWQDLFPLWPTNEKMENRKDVPGPPDDMPHRSGDFAVKQCFIEREPLLDFWGRFFKSDYGAKILLTLWKVKMNPHAGKHFPRWRTHAYPTRWRSVLRGAF